MCVCACVCVCHRSKGDGLLRGDVERVQALRVTKSCTIFINRKKRLATAIILTTKVETLHKLCLDVCV